MKSSDMRAKARAIFGPAVAEPMPNQPNGAKALQQRANARPIPTYKVGGPVKKMPSVPDAIASGNRVSKQEGDEMRFMEMLNKKKRTMPSPAASAASGNRVAKQEGDEMRKMKMAKGGKVEGDKPKDGLAVMIAIGKPMKPTKKMAGGPMDYAHGGKPVKKMNGGPMAARSMDMESSKLTRDMAHGGAPMGYAAGGAAKVRKGMMTPEGKIIDAMNKMRGK